MSAHKTELDMIEDSLTGAQAPGLAAVLQYPKWQAYEHRGRLDIAYLDQPEVMWAGALQTLISNACNSYRSVKDSQTEADVECC